MFSRITNTCFVQANLTERQRRFSSSKDYAQIVVGISFSLSAILVLVATWLKYILRAYQDPLPMMIVGTVLLVSLWGWMLYRSW